MPGCVVAFTVPEKGHLHRMLPVVAGLCEAGVTVHFFAYEAARTEVERTGARFLDLYAGRAVDEADDVSRPAPIRYVSWAGRHGEAVAAEAAALRPGLVLHDTFAVIGRAVAARLRLPRVDVRAGHDMAPDETLAVLRRVMPISVSPACEAAVAVLRDDFGLADASPFSYFIDRDADLNVCAEPPEYLPPERRAPFEPVVFFGSYWSGRETPAFQAPSPFGPGAEQARLRVYISFGTVLWQYFTAEAMAVLEAFVAVLAERPEVQVLISLGGGKVEGRAAALQRPNVRVASYVDQISALREASIHVTHHGLNSTHESAFHGVPMISRPFFGDHFGMAARCQALGIAVSLTEVPGAATTTSDVRRALAAIEADTDGWRRRMAQAQAWERGVMATRGAAVGRIMALMGANPSPSEPRGHFTGAGALENAGAGAAGRGPSAGTV